MSNTIIYFIGQNLYTVAYVLFILFFYSNLATWQLKTKPKQTLNQVNGLKCSKNKK